MRKLAIFDIDGTLTDSVKIHQAAFVHALQESGLKDYSTDWGCYPHHTDSAIFETIFEDCRKQPTKAADLCAFEELINQQLADNDRVEDVQAIPGAKHFLKAIAPQYDIVFATGSLLRPALSKLRQAGIFLSPELIIACNGHGTREEIVAEAIAAAKRFYDVEFYEQTVSFGDGVWDYDAARNLGIPFIGIGNEALRLDGAVVFSDFTDAALYRLLNVTNSLVGCPDFEINATGPVSQAFLSQGMTTFWDAASFIKALPYGRNANKADLTTVFAEGRGTCSTKHALLKTLANENMHEGLQLMTSLFRMNGDNTPAVAGVLAQYGLPFMPEAHNYLRYAGHMIDCTAEAGPQDFEKDLIEETEIMPDQITAHKVAYHRQYLDTWLQDNPDIGYTLNEVWDIREQCIAAMSSSSERTASESR